MGYNHEGGAGLMPHYIQPNEGDPYIYLTHDAPRMVPPRKVFVPIRVVEPKAEVNKQKLVNALEGDTPGKQAAVVVMKPTVVAEAVRPPPEELYSRTIIPLEIRAPTAKLVSEQFGTGYGAPWSTAPPSIILAAPAIGSLLVLIGRQVIAQMAIAGAEEWVGRVKKRYERRDVQFRFMTGGSEGGKGNIVRPRGEDGSIPEGTDPYEDPDDFSIWKPWTWF